MGARWEGTGRPPEASAPKLYVETLNQAFDAQTSRVAGLGNRVPTPVLLLQVIGSAVALALLASHVGIVGRGVIAIMLAALLVSFTLFVSFDLDRPTAASSRFRQRASITFGNRWRWSRPPSDLPLGEGHPILVARQGAIVGDTHLLLKDVQCALRPDHLFDSLVPRFRQLNAPHSDRCFKSQTTQRDCLHPGGWFWPSGADPISHFTHIG